MGKIQKFGHDTFSSLKIRNYRLYFIGQAISFSGSWMQTVALGWLVLQLTGSGTQLGIVVALQFVPLLVGGPWGGVIADRVDKRRILYWTQTLFGVIALVISMLVFTNVIQIWMLDLLALFLGVIRIFDNPARQTFVSEMVDTAHVKNAVTLNSIAVNLARAVGPTLGGIVIASIGIAFCFALNALSYVAFLAALYLMRGEELRSNRGTRSARVVDGIRYVASVPRIRDTLIMIAIIGTLAYEFEVSLPLLASGVFHGSAVSYAGLLTGFGAGAVVGGLFAAGRRHLASHHLIIFALLFGGSLLATSFSSSLGFAIAGMVFVGFFSINFTSSANTLLQLESRPDMRGRVMALWSMATVGSTAVGGPLIGFIGDHAGARWGLGVGGIATFIAAGIAVLSMLRKDTLHNVSMEIEMDSEMATSQNAKL